jgi:hypothetical protein
MRFRMASIFAAGLALSGCAGDVGTVTGFGGGGYPMEPYTYAYSGPYAEYGPVSQAYGYAPDYVAPYAGAPSFVSPFVYEQPGWGGGHWRHDRDWDGHGDWSHQGEWSHRQGDWNHGQPRVWAGPPGGGQPVHMAPPPAPHVDAGARGFVNALGITAPPPAPHAPPPPAPHVDAGARGFVNALGIKVPH